MEAVARQFNTTSNVIVLRNGFFSFRWTDIFDTCKIMQNNTVLNAQTTDAHVQPQMAPRHVSEVLGVVRAQKPAVFFCPHVETSTGILLTDEYIKTVAAEVHLAGGLFVLDGVASGTIWVDMKALGVDVYITAPQKGWTGPAGVALIMLSERATEKLNSTSSDSLCLSLNRWDNIMKAYEAGGHAYHTTMPTEAIRDFHTIV